MSRVVVPVISLLLAAACSSYHTDRVRFDQAVRPATIPDSVRVLGEAPAQSHKVVALVSVTPHLWPTGGYNGAIWHLAQEAAKLGGQAVLIGPESISQSQESRMLTGKVLVFDDAVPANAAFAKRYDNVPAKVAMVATLVALVVPAFFVDWSSP